MPQQQTYALEPGAVVGNHVISSRLGQGGMGQVYLAEHRHIAGHKVAIKFLGDPERATDAAVLRFRREAEALTKLDHPAIINEVDFGFHDLGDLAVPYLVMEYLPGGDLERRLASGPLSHDDTLKILRPIASALEYAHKQGVVHRDLKPANILFTADGQPRLADFGLAAIGGHSSTDRVSRLNAPESGVAPSVEGITRTGTTIGTPGYMSPEQAQGGQVSAATDVYAFGLVYFRCVVGRLPAVGERPTQARPGLPPAADRLFLACIGPLSERPADGSALLALLTREQSSAAQAPLAPALVQPGPLVQPSPRPAVARTRVLTVACGALGLIPGLVAGAIVWAATWSPAAWVLPVVTCLAAAAIGPRALAVVRAALRHSSSTPPPGAAGLLGWCAHCKLPVVASLGRCPTCGRGLTERNTA